MTFTKIEYKGTLPEKYTTLCEQLTTLLEYETNKIANLSNASALLNQFLTKINWVGFYLIDPEDSKLLILGPFQGNFKKSFF